MTVKHRVFRFAVFCLVTVSVFICALTGLYLLLPGYTNSVLLPAIASDLGILRFSCGVRRIGMTGADLGPVIIGDDKKTALSIGAVQIDYTVSELFDKHIRRISISGVDLECGIEKGKILFPGFDPQFFLSKYGKNEDVSSQSTGNTFSFGHIEVRNATLACRWNGQFFLIPFQIEISPRNSSRYLHCVVRFFPRGQKMECVVDVDVDGKTAVAKLSAEKVLLDAFADFTRSVPGLRVSGQADLISDIAFRFDPLSVAIFRASLSFWNKDSQYDDVRLSKYEREDGPARVDVGYDEKTGWEMTGGLALDSPIPIRIPEFKCRAPLSDGFEASGNATVVLKHGENTALPFKMTAPMELKEQFKIKISPTGEWNCHISDSNPKPGQFEIRADDVTLSANSPKFDLTGKGNAAKGSLKIGMAISEIRCVSGGTKVGIPTLSFRAEAAFKDPLFFPKTVALSLDTPGMTVETGGLSAKIPEMSISGVAKKENAEPFHFDGFLKFAKTEMASAESQFRVDGIEGTLPLAWPCDETGPEGQVAAALLRVGKKDLGSIKGAVRQTCAGIEYNALHLSRLISGASLKLKGRSERTDTDGFVTEIDFNTMPFEIADGIDLGRFFKSGKGVTVAGKPSMEGHFSYRGQKSNCSLNVSLENGNVRSPDQNVSFEGIRGGIQFTDLFDLKTAPKQKIGFDKASVGDILFEKGRVEYQIESGGAFFLETGSFKWCQGSVFSQASRITPGTDDFDLVLYCDRLNLALLLEQLGVGNVEGKGTVNGRIPIRYVDGKLSFDDGFLFSTPGDGGSIHVTGMEHLTEGVPEGSLQYAQIELAREALKDFEYKWAKLRMVSKGDDLELRLGFDGKPAHPLPFVFDEKLGGFSKMRADGQKSNFQGIQLDVNVRLPLNDVLRYKDFLKLIQ